MNTIQMHYKAALILGCGQAIMSVCATIKFRGFGTEMEMKCSDY